jgi:anti-sigma B factor antagonist
VNEPAAPLSIESDEGSGLLTLRLNGEFDLAGFQPFLDLLTQSTAPAIRVDLRGLSFIDSSGIRALLTANALAAERGQTLTVVRADPGVHRVLELTGLDDVLAFVEA